MAHSDDHNCYSYSNFFHSIRNYLFFSLNIIFLNTALFLLELCLRSNVFVRTVVRLIKYLEEKNKYKLNKTKRNVSDKFFIFCLDDEMK